jgi:hypothetical protein
MSVWARRPAAGCTGLVPCRAGSQRRRPTVHGRIVAGHVGPPAGLRVAGGVFGGHR